MNIDLIMDSATISQLLEAEDAKMPSSSFNWEGCTYALRSPEGDEWPTLPSRSSLGDVCSRLHIWMDRPPAVSSDSRVRIWYKNCVLPPINVAFNAEGVALDSLSCRLTAVRVDVNEHAAIDEGLQGDTLRPLVQGTCSFTSLLFKTTSYKHKGKPLHLMLTLLSRSGAAGESNVVCNMISPPVIVNARKRQAKEKSPPAMLGSAWTGGDDAKFGSAPTPSPSTLLPFAPGLLERKLEKVEKLSESASRQQIDNSIEGLRAYLSALNIRNKCKHPLFLALRFDSCVRLFYDSHRVCNPLRDDEAFYHMMEVKAVLPLLRTGCAVNVLSSVDPLSTRATGSSNAAELPFVVAVRGDHVSCLRADCPVHGLPVQLTSLFALPHASMLSSTYVELCELQIKHVRSTYCRRAPRCPRLSQLGNRARALILAMNLCGYYCTPLRKCRKCAIRVISPTRLSGPRLCTHLMRWRRGKGSPSSCRCNSSPRARKASKAVLSRH
ncbi:MAG: hypothetical protein SGPRY_007410 [Prymnesium sp.]